MKKIAALLLLIALSANAQVPGVVARSYIVMDSAGNVVVEKDSKTPHPIASITKLLVAEQLAPILEPTSSVTIEPEDLAGKHTRLRVHSSYTEDQLLDMALISSDNQAIYALARSHDTGMLIASVNETAQERGLTTISIEEPSGLSENNVASANDLARFVNIVVGTPVAGVTLGTSVKVDRMTFRTTNPFLGKEGWDFLVTKTGFTHAAGGCIATVLNIDGKQYAIVVLGSRNVFSRWRDLTQLRAYVRAINLKEQREHHNN
jgi:D-alanyl-D-alanine carboxypeptidase